MSAALLALALLSPTSAPVDAQIEALILKLQAPQALEATFTQVKTSRVFKKPLRAQGRIATQRPDKLRWDYTKPYRMSLIKDGPRVTMRYPDMNRTQSYDLDKDPQMKAVFETILFFYGADLAATRARFELEVIGADTLRLIPKGKGAQLLKQAEVTVDPARGALSKLRLVEPDGDETVIEFSAVTLNPEIDPARFTP